jgi:hypothetical protein
MVLGRSHEFHKFSQIIKKFVEIREISGKKSMQETYYFLHKSFAKVVTG